MSAGMATMTSSGNTPSWYALVADDDADSRALMASVLRRADFAVCEAADGEELLERYRALDALTDHRLLVVSDIGMPGLDGITATKALRKSSSELLIVVVTGFTDQETTHAARRAGANVVLFKPLCPEALVRTLQGWRANRSSRD